MHTDQNGIKTSVTGEFTAVGTQAKRYEIAVVGYNSYHWQRSGILIIELFETYYGSGYEKYSVEIGYAQGTQSSSPTVKLIDSQGYFHNGKIELGSPYNLTTTSNGEINKAIPIYLDVRSYSKYKVRFTYLRNKVGAVSTLNEIQINETPTGIDIADFTTTTVKHQSLTLYDPNNHFILGGNMGIGTKLSSNPNNYKLAVNGTIGAKEVVVESNSATWADYVFEENYPLMPLSELEVYLRKNKHLPEIPTAAEVGERGQLLGELNTLLLKKIEELTLYVIDLEKAKKETSKKNNQLEEKVEEYEKTLTELEKRIEKLEAK